MKYFININQLALANSKLDLKDAAILDYLKAFCGVDDKKIKQLTISEEGIDYRYTWINFNYLIKEMPLLGIKQKASISERIKNIEKSGYIKTFRAPDRSLYVRLTPKIRELDFKRGVSLDEQGVSLDEQEVLAKTNSTINILDNNNISNNIATQSVANNNLNNLIGLFKEVNPTYKRLFSNKTQRAALKRLVDEFGEEKVAAMIKMLPKIISKKYAPRITTPYELERDMGKIKAFINQQRSQEDKYKVSIIR